MPKRTSKQVSGNTGRMAQAEAIELATKMLREELDRVKAELNGSKMEAAALRTERDQLRGQHAGLIRDARDALRYCSGLPDFRPGGAHAAGFAGTVGPVLEQLQKLVAEAAATTSPGPQAQPAPTDPVPSP